MKLTEEQEREIWSNVYSVAVISEIDREEFFVRLVTALNKNIEIDELPIRWRSRAKSCNPSASDAFMWAADELEEANKEC